ncbi:mucin-like protein, partial [Actinia tenebrosa]|uniref:Mucin-like protein n=1 Tax=Actinia tenebrosa TaxID=6105 RepID=A0A6P8I813_ACTTE
DGNFSEWSNWTRCSVSCGNGMQKRNRSCSKPTPAYGGNNCTGNHTEIRYCTQLDCPVDGNFSEWSNWTRCSVSCGNGTQERNRSCSKPTPAYGGNNCTGNHSEIRYCTQPHCP